MRYIFVLDLCDPSKFKREDKVRCLVEDLLELLGVSYLCGPVNGTMEEIEAKLDSEGLWS